MLVAHTGVLSLRVAAQALWTPANDAGCVAWFDANAASTMTFSGSNVTAWASRVGSIVMSAPGSPPARQALNGGYALYGAVNYRRVSTSSGLSVLPSGNAAAMMMLVGIGATVGYNNTFGYSDRQIGTVNNGQIGAPTSGADVASNVSYGSNGNAVIVTWDGNATVTENLYADGTLLATKSNRSALSTSTAGPLQALSNTTNAADVIQCGLIRTGLPSAALRQKYEGWAAWAYNLAGSLPAGHPYKSRAPNTSDPG